MKNQECSWKQNKKNFINILKTREIIFGFGTSGETSIIGRFPKGLEDLDHIIARNILPV